MKKFILRGCLYHTRKSAYRMESTGLRSHSRWVTWTAFRGNMYAWLNWNSSLRKIPHWL